MPSRAGSLPGGWTLYTVPGTSRGRLIGASAVTVVVVEPTADSAGHASWSSWASVHRVVAIGLPSSPVGRSTVTSLRLSAASATPNERLKSLWAPARVSVGDAPTFVMPIARALGAPGPASMTAASASVATSATVLLPPASPARTRVRYPGCRLRNARVHRTGASRFVPRRPALCPASVDEEIGLQL